MKKIWNINLRHTTTRKEKQMTLPGGIHEADARRTSQTKAGAGWQVTSLELSNKEDQKNKV